MGKWLPETCWADSKINKIVIVTSSWSFTLFTYMSPVLSWDSTQRRMVICYRRYGTTCRSRLQKSSGAAWILKTRPIGCSETTVTNYHSALRRMPKKCIFHSASSSDFCCSQRWRRDVTPYGWRQYVLPPTLIPSTRLYGGSFRTLACNFNTYHSIRL